MKTLIYILLAILLLGLIIYLVWYFMKPKISIESQDFINKTIDYKISAGGTTMSGKKSLTDAATTSLEKNGYYYFVSSEGGRFVLGIKKNGKVLLMQSIDPTTGVKVDITNVQGS